MLQSGSYMSVDVLKKKKYSVTLVKDGKSHLIQELSDSCGDHSSEVLQWGREIELQKWDLKAKEQGGGQWMKNY